MNPAALVLSLALLGGGGVFAYLKLVKNKPKTKGNDLSLIHILFAAQYQLTLTEEVEIRYRTETSTDPETGETTSEEVP